MRIYIKLQPETLDTVVSKDMNDQKSQTNQHFSSNFIDLV